MLQRYLDNELSDKELARFEQELNSSPDLMVDLDLYKEIDEAISDTEVLDFRAQLTDLRKDSRRMEAGRTILRFSKPWHYAATAAVALLVAIGLATILGQPLSNEVLFSKYMKTYELVLNNRSTELTIERQYLSEAESSYLEGDYQTAIMYFDKVLQLNATKPEANFYKGLSLMEIDNHLDASRSFNKVIDHQDNLYIQKAEWFLAGCLLAMDDTLQAKRKLSKIARSENHYYSKDAKKVLKRMK